MRQITIGHLGHFLLDFFAQIWTQGTLRHILGPILVIFKICQFLRIPGPFEYFTRKWIVSENHILLGNGWPTPGYSDLVLGGEVPRLNHGPICFQIQNT